MEASREPLVVTSDGRVCSTGRPSSTSTGASAEHVAGISAHTRSPSHNTSPTVAGGQLLGGHGSGRPPARGQRPFPRHGSELLLRRRNNNGVTTRYLG